MAVVQKNKKSKMVSHGDAADCRNSSAMQLQEYDFGLACLQSALNRNSEVCKSHGPRAEGADGPRSCIAQVHMAPRLGVNT